MTPHQRRFIRRYPHLAGQILGTETGPVVERPPAPARVALPVCVYRGNLIDTTTCRCKVWACKIHGTCSNSPWAGLTICPCEKHQAPQENVPCS